MQATELAINSYYTLISGTENQIPTGFQYSRTCGGRFVGGGVNYRNTLVYWIQLKV